MLSRRKGVPRTIDFCCDGCSSEVLETEELVAREATAAARDQGWVVAEVSGEWQHYCPGCARQLGVD